MLSALDYAIIAGYVAGITAFGWWVGRRKATTRGYFVDDRSVPWWAVCFTVVATETSTLTFIGVPATAYTGNWTFLQLAAGYVVGRIVVSLLLLPAYFRGELHTSYQLLRLRFGGRVTRLSAGIFLLTRSLADGIRLFATALVVSVVTGIPVSAAVLLLGAVMIVYTVRGGVAAVIWTDVVQMFVYALGAGLVAWVLIQRIPGGWESVIATGQQQAKFAVFDLSLSPSVAYTLWAGLLGGIALTLSTHGTDQFLVQRLLSATSARAAATGLMLSGIIVFAQFVLFLLIGVMLFTFYQGTPLPAPLGRADEILPLFVVHELPHGLAGLIVAAIVAAALSPSLNAMAATTITDFYRPNHPDADEATLLRLSRRATVAWGVVQLLVALAAQGMERSVLDAGLSVLSLASGSVLGAFLLGTLRPDADETAVLWGMVAGLAVMLGVWTLTPVAWTWYVLIGSTTTCAVAVAVDRRQPVSTS